MSCEAVGETPNGTQPASIKWGAHLESTVFQCSQCAYTSLKKAHVETHMRARCQGAMVLGTKCVLPVLAAGQKVAVDEQTGAVLPAGGGNTTTTTTNNNHSFNQTTVNIHVHMPAAKAFVGSEEEEAALTRVLKDPEVIKTLADQVSYQCADEIAARVFQAWKGQEAPPELHNIEVKGDRVLKHREHGAESVPRSKFVKETLAQLLRAVTAQNKDTTGDPEAMETVQDELQKPVFRAGKRERASRLQVAKWHADGAKEVYRLDAHGREFIASSKEKLEREIDEYARYVKTARTAGPSQQQQPSATTANTEPPS